MNNNGETEIPCDITTSWVAEWICPHCLASYKACDYEQVHCSCGAKFDVRKQPYGSKTPVYVVLLPRQTQRPWPAYETK